MKKFTAATLFAISLISALHATPAPQKETSPNALTLRDCFEKAQRQNETLKIQRENVDQAKRRRQQALGNILPDIHWRWDVTWQDTNVPAASSNTSADNALFKDRRTESRFTLHQPIFSGFKEFYAMSAYSAQERSEGYSLIRTENELYQQTAAAFLTVVANETDLFNIRTTIKLNEDRLKELKERVRIGRSRDSEIATASAQWAALKANEARTVGDIAVAREVLSYLVGEDVSHQPLVDNLDIPPFISEEEALRSAEDRSDVKALKEEVQAKKDAVRVIQSAHYPFLFLDGNYYTQKVGFFKDIDWDVVLNLDVPIFQGGTVSAQVKEAVSVLKQAQFSLAQLQRAIHSEIIRAQATLQASLDESGSLEQAYKQAKKSYDLQTKEYRYGLVTNLDVVQSLAAMQDTKTNWDRSVLRSKLNYIQLLTATEKPIQ